LTRILAILTRGLGSDEQRRKFFSSALAFEAAVLPQHGFNFRSHNKITGEFGYHGGSEIG
jgi:hypothetical protein